MKKTKKTPKTKVPHMNLGFAEPRFPGAVKSGKGRKRKMGFVKKGY